MPSRLSRFSVTSSERSKPSPVCGAWGVLWPDAPAAGVPPVRPLMMTKPLAASANSFTVMLCGRRPSRSPSSCQIFSTGMEMTRWSLVNSAVAVPPAGMVPASPVLVVV